MRGTWQLFTGSSIINKFKRMSAMNLEKRRRTRVPLEFQCSIFVGEQEIPVQTKNISLNGMSCRLCPDLIENTNCRVVFTLSEKIKIDIDGRVVRKNSAEAGIFFDKMSEESFYHLKRLVQYNTENPDVIEEELLKPR